MALLGSLARAACGATAKRLARHFPLQSLQLRPPLAPPASLPSSLRTDARRELSTSSGASPTHRPFSRLDVEACRRVKSGKHISPASNPGIRLEGRFLPEDEVRRLRGCGTPRRPHARPRS